MRYFQIKHRIFEQASFVNIYTFLNRMSAIKVESSGDKCDRSRKFDFKLKNVCVLRWRIFFFSNAPS